MPKPVKNPANKAVALKVAYARLQGMSQIDAGAAYGVSRIAIQNWEASEWWPQMLRDADDEFCNQAMARARRTVLQALDEGELSTAKWVLSRMQVLESGRRRSDVAEIGEPTMLGVAQKLWEIAHDENVPAGARAQALTTLMKDLRGEDFEDEMTTEELSLKIRLKLGLVKDGT